MEHAESELLLDRAMPHPGHKRLPERAIIRPCGKDLVDRRVMHHRWPGGGWRKRYPLPWPARLQAPPDEVTDAVLAQVALWTPLGHGEVRQDECGELGCGQLHRDRRRCRLSCRGAHHAIASY